MKETFFKQFACLISLTVCLAACKGKPLNDPHRTAKNPNVLYTVFSERPKTLDPARSYSVAESVFTGQIYEPPLQYHYLKRPYTLTTLTATQLPTVEYLDKAGAHLAKTAPEAAIDKVVYTLTIKPQIFYQEHPAFYYAKQKSMPRIPTALNKFKQVGTREVTAADYVYEIKRLAHPGLNSPVLGFLSQHIKGLKQYHETLKKIYAQQVQKGFLDLRSYDFPGVKQRDRYTYQVILDKPYPQFQYWLAMAFFSAVPWEADWFYAQPGMKQHNFSLDWYPVGSGPYTLTENNPNQRMVLTRNPNFHGERYPTQGMPGDKAKGYLQLAGKPLPFIDSVVFTLEKEAMPSWNKFLQGYYDNSGIASDSFEQAIKMGAGGHAALTPLLASKGIHLSVSVSPSVMFTGFNMLDPVVGGYTEKARALRQAISIAYSDSEYIQIFLNGRGVVAQGPIPPDFDGYRSGKAGVNPYIAEWRHGHVQRKSLATAKQLLAVAGYPHGLDPKTGHPLLLHLEAVGAGSPDEQAQFSWKVKQFKKLGIQLDIRSTTYNRFQDKVRRGKAQLFSWGWHADYPDPENFLFLFYGPNGKAKFNGENAVNYHNEQYDALFKQMKVLSPGPKRDKLIHKMVNILQRDAPWIWGFSFQQFKLSQPWVTPSKALPIGTNTLKYLHILPEKRTVLQRQWNRALLWPLWLVLAFLVIVLLPAFIKYKRRKHSKARLE